MRGDCWPVIALLAFCFGWVACSLHTQYWAKLKPAVGRALAAVFGKQPALAVAPAGHVAAPPAVETKAPTLSTIVKHFGQFAGWCIKHWRLIGCILLALFVISFLKACSGPFEFGKSKEELRLELEVATANAEVSELRRQRDIAIAYADRVNALRQEQINVLSAQGRNEIAEATPEHEVPIDPELSAAWRNSVSRLCIYPGAECSSPDPA